jgi:hypothetical protein
MLHITDAKGTCVEAGPTELAPLPMVEHSLPRSRQGIVAFPPDNLVGPRAGT